MPATPPGVELARDLIARGLVAPRDVLAGDLVMADHSRRNDNVLVVCREGRSFFLKRAASDEDVAALENERKALLALAASDARGLVPRTEGYDAEDALLIIEGFPDAQDAKAFHADEARGYPIALAQRLGGALGGLHAVAVAGDDASAVPPPWPLAIHRPTLDEVADFSPACLELARIAQATPAIGAALDRIREGWRGTTRIHGDVRWENVLLLAAGDPAGPIRIVDWEESGNGDPLWDVGCAAAAYLGSWVWSIDVSSGAAPEDLQRHARRPLASLQAALGALWAGYLRARRLGDAGQTPASDVMRFAGARLLGAAHEAAVAAERLTPHLAAHVQLAANLLAQPDAFSAFFGLRRTPGP